MGSLASFLPRVPTVSRNVLIAGSVLVLHAAALWALQVGLLRRAVELVVPVEILSTIVPPPAPVQPVVPTPPLPPAPLPPEKPRPVAQRPRPQTPAPAPAPRPVAAPSPAPAPQAPVGVAEPQPPAPPIAAPMTAAPAPAPATAPAPAPPAVQLPSTDADYLQNPPPAYPAFSMRLREQGKVLLHVQISAQGTALDAQVKRSSGYPRLDRAAVEAVRKWRYVPGKRGGVPETMWFDVPVIFELERTKDETR